MSIENRAVDALAGGWQISSILALQTGFPITVAYGQDRSNTGAGFDRPNATGIDPNDIEERTTARFFNTAAFVLQPFGSHGNVGRNTLIGPRMFTFDASLLKNFNFTERHYLQFRFEAFNALNHPNWGNPSVNITNPASFGTIGGTRGNMRQLQLALKFVF